MSYLPRMPVRFIAENQELLKSQEGGIAGQSHANTDYNNATDLGEMDAQMVATYRTPPDRVSGNHIFRRYANGALDYDYCKDKIIDALRMVKDSGGVDNLNTAEKVILSVLFPQSFDYVDSGMIMAVAHVQLRLTPEEVLIVRAKVAAHLAEEMNWNAGRGGGSVTGRSETRS